MSNKNIIINRRSVIKQLGFGTIACLFSGFDTLRTGTSNLLLSGQNAKQLPDKKTVPSFVSVIKGNDCRDNTYAALKNIEEDIMASLEGKKRILVKPNFVSTSVPLCATHVDAVRGILDFLKPRWKGPIIVGESTASRAGTMDGFKNYGYLPLEKEYGIQLADLNEHSFVYRYVLGPDNTPYPIRIISTFMEKDLYIISAAKMKTHDRALVTLSLKNILLGAPYNDYKHNDKPHMHLTKFRSKNTILHYNMFSLAREIYPDLGVIDAFESMEGNGPVRGTPVDTRLALASLDPLALDTFATKLMGFDPKEILYLSSMNMAGMGQGDLDEIKTIGSDIQNVQFHFKPNSSMIEPYGLG